MNIVFVGTPAWSSQLAEGIAAYTDASATAVPITSGKELLRPSAWRDVRGADIVVRVGVRPGADTARGRAFDTLLGAARAGAASRTACFWTGTDVLNTLAQAARGDGMRHFDEMASGMTHVAVAEWLRDELASIGIKAELAWTPARHTWRGEDLPAYPDTFTVLSYVPSGRHEFYGGPAVIEVARRLPDIQFSITSETDAWAGDIPDNVTFLGMHQDMEACYTQSSCLVRVVEHDGLSNMVLEALSYGRPVICSAAVPHTLQVDFNDVDGIEDALRQVAASSGPVPGPAERAAADWVLSISDQAECYTKLLSAFSGGPGW